MTEDKTKVEKALQVLIDNGIKCPYCEKDLTLNINHTLIKPDVKFTE